MKSRNRLKLAIATALMLCSLILVPGVVSADPVRITVQFTVAGDNSAGAIDPDFGEDVASGLWSLVTDIPAGGGVVEDFDTGLGADTVSLTFAGTSWTTANADVGRLFFSTDGLLTGWDVSGFPRGLSLIDHAVSPDFIVGQFDFLYTTPRSLQVGIFSGRVLSWEAAVTAAPAPVPEPATLTLLGTGLMTFAAGRKRRKQHS